MKTTDDEVLSATEITCIAAHYDGLELTWVDDETALSRTVGDLCRSHKRLARDLEAAYKSDDVHRAMSVGAFTVVTDQNDQIERLQAEIERLRVENERLQAERDKFSQRSTERRQEYQKLYARLVGTEQLLKWLRLGFRVEWSEGEPGAYEIRNLGCLSSDNDCLARLRTGQEVDEYIVEHTTPSEFV